NLTINNAAAHLNLNGFTLNTTGNIVASQGQVSNGTWIATGALTGAFGTNTTSFTLSATLNITGDVITFVNTTCNNPVTVTKTGTTNAQSNGGNTFNSTFSATINAGRFITANNFNDIYQGTATFSCGTGTGRYEISNTNGRTSTFNGTVIFNVTGSAASIPTVGVNGNVVFNNDVTVNANNSSASTRISFASGPTSTVAFNGTNNLISVGSTGNEVLLCGNGATNINQNIQIDNLSSRQVYTVGPTNTGNTTLAAGRTITAGTFSGSGTLNLRRFTQVGSTAQTITLTGSARLVFDAATFNGNLTATAPRVNLSGSTFNGTTSITQNGTAIETCAGGNVFNGELTLTNSGSQELRMADATADTYNGNATFTRTGTGLLNIAHTGTNSFKGNITVNTSVVLFGQGGGTVLMNGTALQEITPNVLLTFPLLTINNSSGVQMNGDFGISNNLNLINGPLILNSRILTIQTSASITRTNGYIRSETHDLQSGKARALSRIRWNISTNTGSFTFPFGTAAGTYIPFTFNVTSAGIELIPGAGAIFVSTYPTPNSNIPYPVPVTNMNDANGADNSNNAVDRFWRIFTQNYSTSPTATITFTYDEAIDLNGISEADLRAQNYNSVSNFWKPPVGSVNPITNEVTVTGVISGATEDWTLSNVSNPLPVEIVAFTAQPVGSTVLLRWEVTAERNLSKYVIERSIDKITTNPVGEISAVGNHYYQFSDLLPLTGRTYYRLKSVDFDGSIQYSNWVEVFISDNIQFSIFPNPVSGSAVQVKTNYSEFTITVVDLTGKTILSVSGNQGISEIPANLLSKGIYFIKITAENQILGTEKLIVE
ncbi:MAG: T9SS type A sorting domain-containing protein, partial [Bacteroidia bacterium]|nr:T9SS type A sorting domain-containing protein [Bacteroidia bacterium]